MPGVKDAKMLGGIGSILALIPFVSIVGYILVIIALKYIADETKKPSIFQNALYGVIILMIGTVILASSAFSFFFFAPFAFIYWPYGGWGLVELLIAIILLVAGAALAIVGVLFFRRSLIEVGDTFKIDYFKTAATLLFIGAILSIVVVGYIIILIGLIFLIIAFFSLPETYTPPAAGPTSQ